MGLSRILELVGLKTSRREKRICIKYFHCPIGDIDAIKIGPFSDEYLWFHGGLPGPLSHLKGRYDVGCLRMNMKHIEGGGTMYNSDLDIPGTCLAAPREKKPADVDCSNWTINNMYEHKWCPYLELTDDYTRLNAVASLPENVKA